MVCAAKKLAAAHAAMPQDPKHTMPGDVTKLGLPPSAETSETNGNTIKGRNVSGRVWKVRPQKRASTLVKTKTNNLVKSWESRQTEKLARKEALELQKHLQDERRDAAVAKKERRLENEKRRAENEYRNMQKSLQTLNHAKLGSTLKAMSKKQLRQVKKTRLNTKTGVVELVPAYAK
jgi:hypothetical protein|uniref:Coiled-coil domain-containing protein 86 n=1 Tax=Phaeodactylum tricornutum TaxID=2850 RepID=A0A8J9S4F3_PHATR